MELIIQKRQKIIFLYTYRRRSKLSLKAIAKKLKYSKDIVQTYMNKYKETGDIQDKERRSRKKRLQRRRI